MMKSLLMISPRSSVSYVKDLHIWLRFMIIFSLLCSNSFTGAKYSKSLMSKVLISPFGKVILNLDILLSMISTKVINYFGRIRR